MYVAVILACLNTSNCIYFVDETKTIRVDCLLKLEEMAKILRGMDMVILEIGCELEPAIDEAKAPILRFKTFQ